jgi:hypothetical protein
MEIIESIKKIPIPETFLGKLKLVLIWFAICIYGCSMLFILGQTVINILNY